MADLNLFSMQCRLTKDAEYSTFGQNDTAKLKFSIANNVGYGDYKHDNFFNCEMIGKGAAGIAQYMVKGKPIIVSGEIKQERWESQEGKRSAVKLIVRNVNFISEGNRGQASNQAQENNVGGTSPSTPASNPFAQALNNNAVSPENYKKPDSNGYKESMDDIPFGTF